MGYEKRRGVKDAAKVFDSINWTNGVGITKIKRTLSGAGFSEVGIKMECGNLKFDLNYLLDIQAEILNWELDKQALR